MKIAMFTDYFFPELGGIQDSVATIGEALGRRGHHVEICAPRYGRGDFRRIGAQTGERDLGENVHIQRRASLPFPSSTRQSRAALFSPLSWITLRLDGKPDVIHVHSFFGVGIEALLSATCLRIPVIGTNHTTIAGFAPHIRVNANLAASYVRWFYNRCDYITAPSRSVIAELADAGLRRPACVVSNPIDTALFTPASLEQRAALRAQLGLARPTVAYAGRLGPEKNIEVVLQAIAILATRGEAPDLVIAGHGSHEMALRRLGAELGITARLHFRGTLPQPELAALLRASDVFAMMSTSETQSMVSLQAMACGIPVIAAAAAALPEFIGPANGMLIDPHDPGALAGALAALLASPETRRALGAGGRRFAQRHGIETVTDAWETLYRSVLDRRSAA